MGDATIQIVFTYNSTISVAAPTAVRSQPPHLLFRISNSILD